MRRAWPSGSARCSASTARYSNADHRPAQPLRSAQRRAEAPEGRGQDQDQHHQRRPGRAKAARRRGRFRPRSRTSSNRACTTGATTICAMRIAVGDVKRLGPGVHHDHPQRPAIIAVDGAGAVGQGDPVFQRKARARAHLHLEPLRNCHAQTGRDQHPRARGKGHTIALTLGKVRAQIRPRGPCAFIGGQAQIAVRALVPHAADRVASPALSSFQKYLSKNLNSSASAIRAASCAATCDLWTCAASPRPRLR